MTIKGTRVELIDLTYEQQELNKEIADSKGFQDHCICCGKAIKDINKTKWIRLIEGGDFYTEDNQELDPCGDMGWFPIGNICYKKYKENEVDIELD